MALFLGSLTRISNLESRPFQVAPLPREVGAMGVYVAGEAALERLGSIGAQPSAF